MIKSLLLIPFLLAATARAELQVAPLFGDHAVLQQGVKIPVWGTAQPGSRIEVRFRDETLSTRTGEDGRWQVTLSPLLPGEPAELSVSGDGGSVTCRDLLVGEVWFAAGQSNMEMPFNNCENAAEERARVNDPEIRFFKVARKTSETAQSEAGGQWQKMAPGTVGAMSAAAFYFARELQTNTGFPVGIIQSAWGGSPIEAWMSEAALADPALESTRQLYRQRLAAYPAQVAAHEETMRRWEEEKQAATTEGRPFTARPPEAPYGPGSARWLSGLYNGMVHPVIPYAIRGIIWYQGEANSATHSTYAALSRKLIADWRERWGLGDLPFLYVQLPNWIQGGLNPPMLWAQTREAQEAVLDVPGTGMIVTLDIGDPHDVHPKNKKEVGRRLSLLARKQVYGQPVPCESPRVSDCRFVENRAVVSFDHAMALHWITGREDGFELAGADGRFYPATARLSGNSVELHASEVPAPIALRYAWDNNPAALLANEHNLPAAPYRSSEARRLKTPASATPGALPPAAR